VSSRPNEAVLLAHVQAENRHDIDATLATVHPDCVFIDQPLGLRFERHSGARAHYEMWWNAFGNTTDRGGQLHWVHDDLLIADSAFVGTHHGTFAGIAPSHKPFRLPFVVFVEFQDGLLAAERFVYDLNGLLAQLDQPAFDATNVTSPS